MKLAKHMFNEIIFSALALVFFDSLFTGILIFAFGAYISSFFKVNLMYAVIGAAIFFVISLFRKIRINKIMSLEKKYPQLKEKLRTSHDYKDKENPVVRALHTEVINLISDTDINALINQKKLFLKISGISVLFFLTIFFSSYGVNVQKIMGYVPPGIINIDGFKSRAGDFIDKEISLKFTEDFLENGSIAQLGDEELNISLDVYSTELDIDEINEGEEKDFGESYPGQAEAYAQDVYEENINDEHKSVIKNYFERLREIDDE